MASRINHEVKTSHFGPLIALHVLSIRPFLSISSFVFWKHLSSFRRFWQIPYRLKLHVNENFTFTEFYFHPPISMNIIISFVKRKGPHGNLNLRARVFVFTLFFHCVGYINFYNLSVEVFRVWKALEVQFIFNVHFANDHTPLKFTFRIHLADYTFNYFFGL